MYNRIQELNSGRPVNIPGQNSLEKIKNMERCLVILEAKKEKEAEREAKHVQSKIGELSQTIQQKEKEKSAEREVHRRSIMIEMSSLKGIPIVSQLSLSRFLSFTSSLSLSLSLCVCCFLLFTYFFFFLALETHLSIVEQLKTVVLQEMRVTRHVRWRRE